MGARRVISLVAVVVACHLMYTTTAFLLAENCPAPKPCTCSSSSSSYAYIYCQSKSLSTVPDFQPSPHHVDALYIYLYSNSLITVHADALKNLSSINASSVQINLSNNQLTRIENGAFNGFENASATLNLNNNNLTSLPSAITKLKGLYNLDIRSNPIHLLDSSVMTGIGQSLSYLYMDMKYLTQWPPQLRFLNSLQSLTVNYIPFTHLNADIFHGFEHSLTSLTMTYANLSMVPYAVCNLPELTTLTFDNCPNLNENFSTVFEHCSGRHIKLTSLALRQDNLHHFPKVFDLFPSLSSLYLQGNKILTIESESIPYHNSLTHLDMDTNDLTRIPAGLKKLKSLATLDLRSNDITTVEDYDLGGLTNLQTLYLMNNPIHYVSNHAFNSNNRLSTLYLSNTKLVNIPVAVTALPKLNNLNVNNNIECSCDMSYLKHWNASSVGSFSARCKSSSETIKHYIMTGLQRCP